MKKFKVNNAKWLFYVGGQLCYFNHDDFLSA